MAVQCEIYPRQDCSPDAYQLLGQQIEAWLRESSATRFAAAHGINDLLGGELPQPYYIQRLMSIEGRTMPEEMKGTPGTPHVSDLSREERENFRRRLGSKANSRHIEVSIFNPEARNRRDIVESLRRHLDERLIADVLINGVTWNESFDFDTTLYRREMFCCHVVPKESLRGDQLRALGEKLLKWWQRYFTTPELVFCQFQVAARRPELASLTRFAAPAA